MLASQCGPSSKISASRNLSRFSWRLNHCPVAGSEVRVRIKIGKKSSGGNGLSKTVPPLFLLSGVVDEATSPVGSGFSNGNRSLVNYDDPPKQIWTMY